MSVKERIAPAAPQNHELLAILAKTDYAGPALQQHSVYINDLNNQIAQTENLIRQLTAKTKAELKDHEKYRDSTMRRFAYRLGGKKGQEKFFTKAEKEEREYYEAVQEQYKAEQRLKTLQNHLNDALKTNSSLEADVKHYSDAQKKLDELYNSIFGGQTPEFPEEDAAEESVRQARAAYEDVQQRLNATAQAVSILSNADGAMKRSLANMQEALSASSMDMWGFGGGFADMAERNALSQAQMNASQATMLLDQARRIDPTIQPVGPINIAQGNMLSDVLFDNIFSDMRFHEKIKDSNNQLVQAEQRLLGQLRMAKEKETNLRREREQAAGRLETARKDLQRVRQEAFQRIG